MMANQEMLSIDDVTDILALPLLGLVLEDEQVIVSTNRGEPLTLNSVNCDLFGLNLVLNLKILIGQILVLLLMTVL